LATFFAFRCRVYKFSCLLISDTACSLWTMTDRCRNWKAAGSEHARASDCNETSAHRMAALRSLTSVCVCCSGWPRESVLNMPRLATTRYALRSGGCEMRVVRSGANLSGGARTHPDGRATWTGRGLSSSQCRSYVPRS